MFWGLMLTQVLAANTHWISNGSKYCQCEDASLCRPLGAGHQFEIEVIVYDLGGMDWKKYDWSKVTAVVINHSSDDEILCHAHANGVRVIPNVEIRLNHIRTTQSRLNFSRSKVSWTKAHFMDGINLSTFEIIAKKSADYYALNMVIQEITETFHQEIPGSQVSFNVPWSPHCEDARCYDFLNISQTCDFLHVASYDIPFGIPSSCIARSNAPYHRVWSGLSAFIGLGIGSRKLVLGVPWYGSDYTCVHLYEHGNCLVDDIPFNGIRCSNHAAAKVEYKQVMQLLPRSISGRFWDDVQKAPYFVYMVGRTYHEVWYDDPESISMRSTFLKKLKLRGIGVWAANYLNYSGELRAAMQTEEMWNALCPP